MMTVLSLMYIRPKAQVRPSRHSRAMAPITQDLEEEETQDETENRRPCHLKIPTVLTSATSDNTLSASCNLRLFLEQKSCSAKLGSRGGRKWVREGFTRSPNTTDVGWRNSAGGFWPKRILLLRKKAEREGEQRENEHRYHLKRGRRRSEAS